MAIEFKSAELKPNPVNVDEEYDISVELADASEEEKIPFAVYSASDTSLTFYADTAAPAAGGTYNGKTATAVYTGFGSTDYTSSSSVPWNSRCSSATSVVVDKTFSSAQPISLAYWFYDFQNASFAGLENIDTSKVTTLYYTFRDCYGLTNVDGLSGWDTSSVTTLYGTFYYCNGLTNVDALSGWDTSKVETLQYTFYHCTGLTNVDDLVGWDTSNVTTLSGTFRYCTGLTNINISGWNTSAVTGMASMFSGCSSLTTIYSDDSVFVTTKVTSGTYMFLDCTELVGGNGTKYKSSNTSYTYAHVDVAGNPGYFTDVAEKDAP